jgi:hypothetical protein
MDSQCICNASSTASEESGPAPCGPVLFLNAHIVAKRYPERVTKPYAHPAALEDEDLLKQCEIGFGRTSGPGGQHRNRVETAVFITHKPTGTEASASERRKQYENRLMAIKRLRLKLAINNRTLVHPQNHKPSELWRSRRQGEKLSVNPSHHDYPALLAEALDVIWARKYDVAGAAGVLGITMSQLAKLIRHEKHAFAKVNEGRTDRGLPALK